MSAEMQIAPKKRGPKLHTLREKSGVNLRELAEVCGIDFSLISKYETGKRPLSMETYLQCLDGIEKILDRRRKRGRVIGGMANLAAIAGLKWEPSGKAPSEVYSEAFADYLADHSGNIDRLKALQGLLSQKEVEFEHKLAGLEKLQAEGIDSPIISGLIESFRREIAEIESLRRENAELKARIKELVRELESAVTKHRTSDADD